MRRHTRDLPDAIARRPVSLGCLSTGDKCSGSRHRRHLAEQDVGVGPIHVQHAVAPIHGNLMTVIFTDTGSLDLPIADCRSTAEHGMADVGQRRRPGRGGPAADF